MQRGSDRHGQRLDEELGREAAGVRTGSSATHAEEDHSAEPSGEDQPDVERAPEGTMGGGASEGLTAEQVEQRSEIARWLDRSHYPAVREVLIGDAIDNHAPDAVIAALKRLPSGREYANTEALWEALTG
jgi:hypothetical protein